MVKINNKIVVKIGIALATIAFIGWVAWDNARIVVNTIEVKSARLPGEFDGFRIAQISDLHNDEFGADNERLLALLEEQKPDMIAITGDLLDARRTNVDKVMTFVNAAVEIAPCHYVTGNHEGRTAAYEELEPLLIAAGVRVLRNDWTVLQKDGEEMLIAGVDDPRFVTKSKKLGPAKEAMVQMLSETLVEIPKDAFCLLLSHRPEMFEEYCKSKVDLVLSGHVHGGQFRLPVVGGLIGPPKILFPYYDAGVFAEGDTKMIVSRGLGQSVFPFRVNNPPELVVVELRTAK